MINNHGKEKGGIRRASGQWGTKFLRASLGAAVKLCLGDLLVMSSNPETTSLHMQG